MGKAGMVPSKMLVGGGAAYIPKFQENFIKDKFLQCFHCSYFFWHRSKRNLACTNCHLSQTKISFSKLKTIERVVAVRFPTPAF